jgi:hypothetical protein
MSRFSNAPRVPCLIVRKLLEVPLIHVLTPEETHISVHCHWQITNALADRDPERAESIMKHHLFETRDLIFADMRAKADGVGRGAARGSGRRAVPHRKSQSVQVLRARAECLIEEEVKA